MKVLVTGGMGFIGTHLVNKLRSLDHVVDVIDLKNGKDIRTYKMQGDYAVIFHLAAFRSVPNSFELDREYFDNNVYGSYKVFEAFKGQRIVNISTSSVNNPIAPYGLTKKLAEVISENYPNLTNLRLFNPFGEGVYDDDLVIPTFARAMLNNKDVYIHSNGNQNRDFTYVQDVVNEIVYYGLGYKYGWYEIGYNESYSVNEIFNLMSKYYGYTKEPIYQPRRKGDQAHTKARDVMHVNHVGFLEGLKRTMDWFKKERG